MQFIKSTIQLNVKFSEAWIPRPSRTPYEKEISLLQLKVVEI